MIDMTKKYQTRDGRYVRLLCTDRSPPFTVVGMIGHDQHVDTWTAQGFATEDGRDACVTDLVEVVPAKVSFCWAHSDGGRTPSFVTIEALRSVYIPSDAIAILRTTVRNGGKSHTDVSVDVLPADYQEQKP